MIDSYWNHMHAKSEQLCDRNASSHGVITYLYRDSTYRAGDSDVNFGGSWAYTDAWISCHDAGDHTWWNYSDFSATVGGVFKQGPAGYFAATTKRCF